MDGLLPSTGWFCVKRMFFFQQLGLPCLCWRQAHELRAVWAALQRSLLHTPRLLVWTGSSTQASCSAPQHGSGSAQEAGCSCAAAPSVGQIFTVPRVQGGIGASEASGW